MDSDLQIRKIADKCLTDSLLNCFFTEMLAY